MAVSSRCARVLVLICLAMTACTNEQNEALNLAREACNVEFPDLGGDVLTDADARAKARDKFLPLSEEVANKAAQAARRDTTWQPLATAADDLAELVSVTIDLGDLRATKVSGGYSTPEDVDKDTQLEARHAELVKKSDAFNDECRKTTD
ncbi:hypothetical protein ACGFNQ_04530 [Streptomyces asoensis]|uniref:hypothetical protein n=1 Tax=Streptomyces asoensis TaxID=249586 RepID=UPI003716CA0A